MKVCANDLLRATSFAEASPILETIKATPSQKRLVEIAFANPNQKSILLNDVIREQEEKKFPGQDDKTDGEKDVEKKVTEEEVTGGGAGGASGTTGSEQSSDTTQPYPKEGKEAPNSDVESMETASGEDQMTETYGQPQPMPGMGVPQIAPDLQKQMGPPQMPPGVTPQAMRQMQYTVQTYTKPVMSRLGKVEEALVNLNKKLQEMETSRQVLSHPLNIPTGQNSWFNAHTTKETISNPLDFANEGHKMTPKVQALDQKRNEIANLDKMLAKESPYR